MTDNYLDTPTDDTPHLQFKTLPSFTDETVVDYTPHLTLDRVNKIDLSQDVPTSQEPQQQDINIDVDWYNSQVDNYNKDSKDKVQKVSSKEDVDKTEYLNVVNHFNNRVLEDYNRRAKKHKLPIANSIEEIDNEKHKQMMDLEESDFVKKANIEDERLALQYGIKWKPYENAHEATVLRQELYANANKIREAKNASKASEYFKTANALLVEKGMKPYSTKKEAVEDAKNIQQRIYDFTTKQYKESTVNGVSPNEFFANNTPSYIRKGDIGAVNTAKENFINSGLEHELNRNKKIADINNLYTKKIIPHETYNAMNEVTGYMYSPQPSSDLSTYTNNLSVTQNIGNNLSKLNNATKVIDNSLTKSKDDYNLYQAQYDAYLNNINASGLPPTEEQKAYLSEVDRKKNEYATMIKAYSDAKVKGEFQKLTREGQISDTNDLLVGNYIANVGGDLFNSVVKSVMGLSKDLGVSLISLAPNKMTLTLGDNFNYDLYNMTDEEHKQLIVDIAESSDYAKEGVIDYLHGHGVSSDIHEKVQGGVAKFTNGLVGMVAPLLASAELEGIGVINKVLSTALWTSTIYGESITEYLKNSKYEKVPLSEIKAMTFVPAVVQGLIMSTGLKFKTTDVQSATYKIMSNMLRSGERNVGVNGVKDLAKKYTAEYFARVGSNVTHAGITGLSTSVVNDLGRNVSDALIGEEVQIGPAEVLTNAFESAGQWMLTGLAFSAIPTAVAIHTENKVDAQQFGLALDMVQTPTRLSFLTSKIKDDLTNGRITKPEAELQMASVESLYKVGTQIPSHLNAGAKFEAFKLLREKNVLEKKIGGLNEILSTPMRERVKEIDGKLLEISKDPNSYVKPIINAKQGRMIVGNETKPIEEVKTENIPHSIDDVRDTEKKLKKATLINENAITDKVAELAKRVKDLRDDDGSISDKNTKEYQSLRSAIEALTARFLVRGVKESKYEQRPKSEKEIAELYHQAKADGTNPDFVKAVEELLTFKSKDSKGEPIKDSSNIAITNNTNPNGKIQEANAQANKGQDVLTPNETVGGNSPTIQNKADIEKRISEIQDILSGDSDSMQKTGSGKLIPDARKKLIAELEQLKKDNTSNTKIQQNILTEDNASANPKVVSGQTIKDIGVSNITVAATLGRRGGGLMTLIENGKSATNKQNWKDIRNGSKTIDNDNLTLLQQGDTLVVAIGDSNFDERGGFISLNLKGKTEGDVDLNQLKNVLLDIRAKAEEKAGGKDTYNMQEIQEDILNIIKSYEEQTDLKDKTGSGVGGDVVKGDNPRGGTWEKVITNESDGQGGNIKRTRFKTTRIRKGTGEEVQDQDGTRAGTNGRQMSWEDFQKEFELDNTDGYIDDLFDGRTPESVTIHEIAENDRSGKKGMEVTIGWGIDEKTGLRDNSRLNLEFNPKEQSLPTQENPSANPKVVGGVGDADLQKQKIADISKETGIEFKKSNNSNSWYGENDTHRIRISDHPSKFVEKSKENNLGDAIDLDINHYSKDAIVHLLNNTDPFAKYEKGDKITHSAKSIGEVTYISSDYKKGYVEVETKDGRIVKYDMGKFLGNENNLQEPNPSANPKVEVGGGGDVDWSKDIENVDLSKVDWKNPTTEESIAGHENHIENNVKKGQQSLLPAIREFAKKYNLTKEQYLNVLPIIRQVLSNKEPNINSIENIIAREGKNNAKDKVVVSGVVGDKLNENEFSDIKTNVRNEETRKLINAVAEIYGKPLYIGNFLDGYVSRLQNMGTLGEEVATLLNSPKKAAKAINEFVKKSAVEQSTTQENPSANPKVVSGTKSDVMPKEIMELYSDASTLRFTLNALKMQMNGKELVGKAKSEYESTKTKLDNIELKLSEYEQSINKKESQPTEVKKKKGAEKKQTFEAGEEANYYDDLFDKTDKVQILYKTGDGDNGTERYQVKFENGQEASIWSDKLQQLPTQENPSANPKVEGSGVGDVDWSKDIENVDLSKVDWKNPTTEESIAGHENHIVNNVKKGQQSLLPAIREFAKKYNLTKEQYLNVLPSIRQVLSNKEPNINSIENIIAREGKNNAKDKVVVSGVGGDVEVTPFKQGDGGTKGVFEDEDGNVYKSVEPQEAVQDKDGNFKRQTIKDAQTDEYEILSDLQDNPHIPKIGKIVTTTEGKAFEIEKLDEVETFTKEEYRQIQGILNDLNDKGYHVGDKVTVMRRPKTGELVVVDFSAGYKGSRMSRDADEYMQGIKSKLSKSDEINIAQEDSAENNRSQADAFFGDESTTEYYLTQRPPSIGTHPTEGLKSLEESEYRGRKVWKLTYDKKLSADQIYKFELTPLITNKEYLGQKISGLYGKNIFHVSNIDYKQGKVTLVSELNGKEISKDLSFKEFQKGIDDGKYKVEQSLLPQETPSANPKVDSGVGGDVAIKKLEALNIVNAGDAKNPINTVSVNDIFKNTYEQGSADGIFETKQKIDIEMDALVKGKSKEGTIDIEVSVNDLVPTQAIVDKADVASKINGEKGNFEQSDKPLVFEKNGKYYIVDGHNRIAADILKGKDKIQVRKVEQTLPTQEVKGKPLSEQIADLRAKEQAEYDAMSDPNDKVKRDEIYDRYDELITPLIREQKALESTDALKDVESTAKALEGKDITQIKNTIANPIETLEERVSNQVYKDPNKSSRWRIKNSNFTYSSKREAANTVESAYKRDLFAREQQLKKINNQSIAEAYHKAKADDSNPELVKAVESLLSKEQAPALRDVESKSILNSDANLKGAKETILRNGVESTQIDKPNNIKAEDNSERWWVYHNVITGEKIIHSDYGWDYDLEGNRLSVDYNKKVLDNSLLFKKEEPKSNLLDAILKKERGWESRVTESKDLAQLEAIEKELQTNEKLKQAFGFNGKVYDQTGKDFYSRLNYLKSHPEKVVSEKAESKEPLVNNKLRTAISEGRMTANDAKVIIESAGLEVPKDIESLLSKETAKVEQPKVDVNNFTDFEKIVQESKTVKEAYDKVQAIKDVPSEVSQAFKEKYDADGKLTPKQAFKKFYDEVKSAKKSKQPTKEVSPSSIDKGEAVSIPNKQEPIPEPTDKQKGTSKVFEEKAKKLADKFRDKLKTKPLTFKDNNGNNIPIQMYGLNFNEIIELGAKAIELSGKIADGIKKVSDHLREQDWYKNLTKENKDAVDRQVVDYFLDVDGNGSSGEITHAANEVRRQARGLPEYQKSSTSAESLMNEAEKMLKDGYDVEDLMNRLESGATPEPVENFIRKIYAATLDAEIAKNPTDELLAKQKRFAEIGDLVNSKLGLTLWSLQGEGSPLVSISDFYVAKMEALGVDKLTDEQKKDTKEAFDKVQNANENADTALQEYKDEVAKLKSEIELLKQKKESTPKSTKEKKSHEDFVAERKDIAKSIAEKWKNAGKDILSSDIPYRSQLFAIAPDVARLMKSYVQEGAIKLEEVVKKIHNEIKEFVPEITEKDIHNIIAGEYNKKLPTRNELSAKMRDLTDEAKYINKLETILSGEDPRTEKEKIKRNQNISALQKKIKDLQKDLPATDADLKKRLKGIKVANEKATAKIKERIAKGEFELKKEVPFMEDKEMQRKFPKEYKAALDAILAREEARHEFDIALLKDQQSKRSNIEKGADLLSKTMGTVKAIVTGIDDSAIAIQTYMALLLRPKIGATALKLHAEFALSQKKFDRWLTAIHNSSDYKLMQDSGLDITEPKSLLEGKKEEIFNNRFDGTVKIKGKEYQLIGAPLKPFERAFTTLGNATRVLAFRAKAEQYMRQGYTFESHPELFKSLAQRLNTETGRGKQNEYIEKATKVVTMGIWSPKLMSSKFNILGVSDLASLLLYKSGTKGYYRQLHPKERQAAIVDVAKFATAVAAISYGAALAFGGMVDDDPLSPTFLDVKFDNGKSYNFSGGFSSYMRTIWEFIRGKKSKDGEVSNANSLDIASRFFRGKVPPITGALINTISKRDFMGNETSLVNEAKNVLLPISVKGIYSQIERDGAMSLFTQGIPTFVGFNVKDERDYHKESILSETDKAKPVIKYFADKGAEMPTIEELGEHPINDEAVRKQMNISEYSPELQKKYADAYKAQFGRSLAKIKSRNVVFVNDYDKQDVSINKPEKGRFKVVPIDKLDSKQLTKVMGIAKMEARTFADERVFNMGSEMKDRIRRSGK